MAKKPRRVNPLVEKLLQENKVKNIAGA